MSKFISFVLVILLAFYVPVRAQSEYGAKIISLSYQGDLNQTQGIPLNIGLGVMGFFKKNHTDAVSTRISLGFGLVNISSNRAPSYLRPSNLVINASTASDMRSFIHSDISLEYNFLDIPYKGNHTHRYITPYLGMGLGAGFLRGMPIVYVPLTLGLKLPVSNSFTLETSIEMLNLFTDRVDNASQKISFGATSMWDNFYRISFGFAYRFPRRSCP